MKLRYEIIIDKTIARRIICNNSIKCLRLW